MSLNTIVIEYNVTIKDHPLLANDSKHWVGAGMRSGYQMLWVGQEALYVYKVCFMFCARSQILLTYLDTFLYC